MEKEQPKGKDISGVLEVPATAASFSLEKDKTVNSVLSQSNSNPRVLAAMPLGVLLPELGELSHLYQLRDEIKDRYKSLHAENASTSNDASRETAAEESMLNQILQWLSLGVKEDDR